MTAAGGRLRHTRADIERERCLRIDQRGALNWLAGRDLRRVRALVRR